VSGEDAPKQAWDSPGDDGTAGVAGAGGAGGGGRGDGGGWRLGGGQRSGGATGRLRATAQGGRANPLLPTVTDVFMPAAVMMGAPAGGGQRRADCLDGRQPWLPRS
jgi:hypothetical protein